MQPCDEHIEARFIAAVIKDGTGERWQESRELPPEAFVSANTRKTWERIRSAATYEAAAVAGASYFAHDTIGTDYKKDLWALQVELLRLHGPQYLADVARLCVTGKSKLLERMQQRQFNQATPPPEPVSRFLINDRGVSTPGNLTNIIAQAKAGKTAFIAAMIAARICAEMGSEQDTLGVSASLAPGRLIHLDTEQSPYDHDQLVRRACRRAGVEEAPGWLYSYSLAGFSAAELRQTLKLALEVSKADGVFAVIIDGTADLVNDVNDAKECNPFVAELHDLAIRYACPIINVVHENPGQTAGKMRGHLGSQLERKAESNLRLQKTGNVTTVFSEKMRKAPILERDGPRFEWDDMAGMHMSTASGSATRESSKVAELRALAAEIFCDGKALRFTDMTVSIAKARRCSDRTAERRVNEMREHNLIHLQRDGTYLPTTDKVPTRKAS